VKGQDSKHKGSRGTQQKKELGKEQEGMHIWR